MTLPVLAPVSGTVTALSDVPDEVFAQAMVGPGVAIDPGIEDHVDVRAPIDGVVAKLHPHAVAIVGDRGRAVLVHVGIDTVELQGAGFAIHATENGPVTTGQPLVSFSPRQVSAGGRSPLIPVIALDTRVEALTFQVQPGEQIRVGEELLRWQ